MKFDVMNVDDLSIKETTHDNEKARKYMMYLLYAHSDYEIMNLIKECKKEVEEDITTAIGETVMSILATAEKIVYHLSCASGGYSQISREMIVDSIKGRVRNSGLSEESSYVLLREVNNLLCDRFNNNKEEELKFLLELM